MHFLAAQSLPQQTRILDALSTAQLFLPIALCITGVLLMLLGFKAYRWIVLLNFVCLGWWLGEQLGERAQVGPIASVLGAVLMGAAALPLMRFAVAVCGGMVGAVIGMVIWAHCEQPLDMAWAGGLVGLAVLGMLSFVQFKTTVILFTSIEGAAMFVLGVCALLLRYQPWANDVNDGLQKPLMLPVVITAIAMVALFWQHQWHGLIGNDGSPAGTPKPSTGESKKK